MKNRKSVMTVSALLIIVFHLWIFLFEGNQAERFLKLTSYIGVDMFFFLSAYSLGGREVRNYGDFLLKRFKSVYVKFALFALVAFIYSGWKPIYFLKVISGVNLFQKGGGAFLWFLPAIMLFYIVLPLYQRFDKKYRILAPVAALVIWLGVGLLVTKFTNYRAMFIFWNRIPVILAGFYSVRILEKKELDNKLIRACLGAVLMIIGTFALLKWGYKPTLQVPVRDMFYVCALPSAIGLILLSDLIPENKFTKLTGSATLEMYAVQMIFGYNFCNMLVNRFYTDSQSTVLISLLINIVTIVFVVITAVIINQLYRYITEKIGKILRIKRDGSN